MTATEPANPTNGAMKSQEYIMKAIQDFLSMQGHKTKETIEEVPKSWPIFPESVSDWHCNKAAKNVEYLKFYANLTTMACKSTNLQSIKQ